MNIKGKEGIKHKIISPIRAIILRGFYPFHLSGVPFNSFESIKIARYAIQSVDIEQQFVNAFQVNILLCF